MGPGHKKAVVTLSWIIMLHFTIVAGNRTPIDSKLQYQLPPVPVSMADSFQSILKDLNVNVNPELLEDLSNDCMAHLMSWSQNLVSLWSIEMLDAMSKIPEGMLSGHTNALGDFDECLAVRAADVNLTDGSKSDFKGQYCSTQIFPKEFCQLPEASRRTEIQRHHQQQELQPRMGVIFEMGLYPLGGAVCVPNKCTQEELQMLLLATTNTTGVCIMINECQTDDKPELRPADIVMISLLSTIGVLCVVGTAVDLGFPKSGRQSKAIQGIIAFSVYTNTKKWLNTSGGSDNLGCIHGIRFLSACWVVLAHTWSIWLMKIWNIMDVISLTEDWTIFPIMNGTVSVDTFFTLAGILCAYTMLKMLDKTKGRLNVPMIYLHRYLRLSPTYAILIGIMATWFEYLKKGPPSNQLVHAGASCRQNWWHNLLYINNLVKYSETYASKGMCHGESWYLANDMQFFLISPLLLWPLWKWRTIGSIIMGGFTIASVVVPFAVTYHYELLPTSIIVAGFEKILEYQDKAYIKPWMRFGPYVVGLWAGFFLYLIRKRKSPFKLPTMVVVLGWLSSTAIALAVMFGPMSFFQIGAEHPRLSSSFYGGFHRFAWGLSISWVVLACTMGYGGIINTFLSWKVFVPLGRLSFCVYMISYWLQTLYYSTSRQYMTYDLYTGINHFFAHMVMSLLISFVACMAFESPFIALEKIIFGGEKRPVPAPPFAEKSVPNMDSNDNGAGINDEARGENEKSDAVKSPV